MTFGVAVKDRPQGTSQERKAIKDAGADAVPLSEFEAAAQSLVSFGLAGAERAEQALSDRLDEHRATVDYTEEAVKRLGPDIRATLGQFHDYRALAGRVVRNISAHLEHLFPKRSLEEQLDKGPHEIVAAYWAARLMIDKFDTALFLLEPDTITATADPPFRFHGLALKYIRIYQRDFDQNRVVVHLDGESRGYLAGNSKAISVIVHTFLDNAAKYAPTDSDVDILFDEDDDSISFSVSSLGPKILQHERLRIFEPFVRGAAAKEVAAEGMGFGLAVCQLIAHRYGTEVVVTQDNAPERGKYFRTTFAVRFAKPDPEEGRNQRRL